MAAIWIIVAVVVVALVVVAAVALRTRRRPPAEQPSAGTPGAGTLTRPPGAPPDTLREPAPAPAAEAPAAEPVAPPGFRERLGRARGLFSPVRAVRGRGSVDAETGSRSKTRCCEPTSGSAPPTRCSPTCAAGWVRVRSRAPTGSSTPFARTSSGSSRCPRGDLRRRGRPRLGGGGPRGAPAHDGAAAATAGAGAGDGAVRSGRQLHFDQAADVTNVWLFVGVKRRGQDHDGRQGGPPGGGPGPLGAARRGDTFRAAAGEQLAQWAERSEQRSCEGPRRGPLGHRVRRGAAGVGACNDLVLADTAGRLHTKVNLVEELKKIRRVADRPPGVVSESCSSSTPPPARTGWCRRASSPRPSTSRVWCSQTRRDRQGRRGDRHPARARDPREARRTGGGPDDLVAFDPQAFVDALLDA